MLESMWLKTWRFSHTLQATYNITSKSLTYYIKIKAYSAVDYTLSILMPSFL